MNNPTHKVCTKCAKYKPLEEFHHMKKGPLGRQTQCKICIKQLWENTKKRHAADPKLKEKYLEAAIKRNKKRYAENPGYRQKCLMYSRQQAERKRYWTRDES